MHRLRNILANESGISLIELLVAIGLLAIVMAAVTSILISNMMAQQKIDAQFRSQLDVRQALYDMEKNLSEAKRKDASIISRFFRKTWFLPSQNGANRITYIYTNPLGASSRTLMRRITDARPIPPIIVVTTDHQMINITAGGGTTSVERIEGRPIFTYFGADGVQITAPVTTPRNVRSVQVSFQTFVSGGHGFEGDAQAVTRIKLQNY